MVLEQNRFESNFAGFQGTAVHIYNFRQVRIYSNQFLYNGPVLSTTEPEFSTFYKVTGYSTLINSYWSFSNEFIMAEQMLLDNSITYGEYFLPIVMGALSIEHCKGTNLDCLIVDSESWKALVDVRGNKFEGNFAMPVTRPTEQSI